MEFVVANARDRAYLHAMTNLGGAQHTWNSTQTSRLRDELMVGYERILATLPGLDGPGVGQIEVMVTAAQSALRESPPTWLSDAAAGALGRGLATPAAATDLTAAGGSGFLLFESPVTMTTLGYAGPAGVAPLDAMLWWSASFDGHDLHHDADHADLVVVHGLSTYVTNDAPWPASVWADSTLTDIGMFPLPLLGEVSPPHPDDNDLAPAIVTLLGLGAAVREDRVMFSAAGPSTVGSAAPRAVEVVL